MKVVVVSHLLQAGSRGATQKEQSTSKSVVNPSLCDDVYEWNVVVVVVVDSM